MHVTYHRHHDWHLLTVKLYVWVQASPKARYLIVHYTLGPKRIMLRPCPTQESRPKRFRPDSAVIPSMRKREVGLCVGLLVRRCGNLHYLIIKIAGARSHGTGNLVITSPTRSRLGHNLHELDIHLEAF